MCLCRPSSFCADPGSEKYSWNEVAVAANIGTYSEVNHGLLSLIHALKEKFQNGEAGAATERILEKPGCIWMPSEGGFPYLIRQDIISAFESAGANEIVFIPEFPELDPVQHLNIADLYQSDRGNFPERGTMLPPDKLFLFTVDWDSFFTLLYGPLAFVSELVRRRQLEGLRCPTA